MVFEYAIHLGEQHKKSVESFLNKEHFPIPHGFKEEDVNLEASRLFSDEFCLFYLHQMTTHGISGYGVSLPVSSRKDIRNYFVECNTSGMELYNRTIDILLEKGLYERPPNISTPSGVDFIQNKSFMTSWLGERRPVNVVEISQIHFNLKKTILAKDVALGFSQVTKSEEVRQFLAQTSVLANKHIDEFSNKLQEDNLPTPSSYEDQITNSTVSPFSDRLMMFHIGFLYQSALAYYGSGMAVSMRPDIIVQYEKIILKVVKAAGKWIDIMIKKGWMEQPPQADDRGALTNAKK